MTVSSSTARADYNGNGSTTAFTVPFYFLNSSHLLVLSTVVTTGVSTTLILGTDYTVTGVGVPAGGTVTTTVAPITGVKLSILRNVPITQTYHYVANDPFPAASHENAIDLLTMEVQQVNEVTTRSITLPPSTSGVTTTLPTPMANNVIGWDPTGTSLVNYLTPISGLYWATYGNADIYYNSGGVGTSGDLRLTGTGKRIFGNFSDSTLSNRVLFQNNTPSGNTAIGLIPSGFATTSSLNVHDSSDINNSSQGQLAIIGGDSVRLSSVLQGTGVTLPLKFHVGGLERMSIDTSGNALVTSPAGLGYGTGAGGSVIQTGSRTTGVTLNKPTGAITMVTAAGSTTAATFTLTNSLVALTDTIILSQKSGTNLYNFIVTAVAAGSFNITFYTTGGVASDTPVVNFAIIKGVTA